MSTTDGMPFGCAQDKEPDPPQVMLNIQSTSQTKPVKLGIYCPGNGTGGPWRYVHSILRRIDALEFDVTLFCNMTTPYVPRPEFRIVSLGDPGMVQEVVSTEAPTKVTHARTKFRIPSNLAWTLGFLKDARRLAKLFQPHALDVIHTQNTGCEESPVSAWMAGIPRRVGTFHVDPSIDLHGSRSGSMYRLAEAVSNRCLTSAIAVSYSTKASWVARSHLDVSSVETIYNGIDVLTCKRRQSRTDARSALGLPESALLVGGLGRLDEAKGFRFLIEAVSLLKGRYANLMLVIAGEGRERDRLEQLIERLGLGGQVCLLGFRQDTQRFLDALDIFAFPSLSETLGYALLEAMATELPCVGTRVGGIAEVISEFDTGLLAAPGSAEDLAAAISVLAESVSLRERYGRAGRNRVARHFREEDMVQRTLSVYRRTANQRSLTSDSENVLRDTSKASAGVFLSAGHRTAFECPSCPGSELEKSGDVYECRNCNRSYSETLGVPSFLDRPDYYWGELDRSTMRKVLASADSIVDATRHELARQDAGLRDYLRQYIFAWDRAAWVFLLAPLRNASVLDVGCGLGSLSMSLAPFVSRLYVCDAVPERVAFTMRRLREASSADVIAFCSNGFPRLPLADGSIDLVVINGVLEWLPSGVEGDPESIQQQFLREVGRVLRPNGQLYLGIENRFGGGYFRGKREEHTKLRYISLLPRPLGRVYHRLAGKGEYRALTHGRRAMETLLYHAGFSSIEVLNPYPDYREFSSVVAVDDRRWVRHSFRPVTVQGRLAHRVVQSTGLLGHFSNSFGFVAQKGERQPSWLELLLTDLKRKALVPMDAALLGYHIRPTGVVSVYCGNDSPTHLLSIPLHARAGSRLLKDVQMAQTLCTSPDASDLETLIKADVLSTLGEITIAVTNCARGERLKSLPVQRKKTALAHVWKWLTDFHVKRRRCVDFSCSKVLPEGGAEALSILDARTGGALGRLLQRCETKTSWVGAVHGDFHEDNVFILPSGELERVIDWDLASLNGLPLWDPFTLILRQQISTGASWAKAYQYLYDLCLPSVKPTHPLSDFISRNELKNLDVVAAMLTLPVVHLGALKLYTEQDGSQIIEGSAHVLDAGRVLLLDAVLSAEDGT